MSIGCDNANVAARNKLCGEDVFCLAKKCHELAYQEI
jgi:hypothetical protein